MRWIFEKFQGTPTGVLPSHKDGCFVLLSKERILEMKDDYLCLPIYSAMQNVHDDDFLRNACEAYLSVAEHVDSTIGGGLHNGLVASIRKFGMGGLISCIQTTIKTHKVDGEVKPRVIHCCGKHPFWSSCAMCRMSYPLI